ncbi:glycosyltransferase family 4 protein [Terrihabitans rhizophilus]|uniref:Glycosyltransferase family 4 protein n=1 Tax=Terrihabitans rhizophilus TaxID=3092662 RepID=A0ABU4RJL0_9HYPH|nr:glycosyltransferase family 4 protein [Terrihabitans sp. PJ23]MDX6805002.1 glycosyltransferase family 4 protein [Terrihabitans sp. PJ23]
MPDPLRAPSVSRLPSSAAALPSSLRVVHVVRQFRPGIGGLEESVHRLCARLSEKIRVDIVTLDRLFSNPRERLPARDVVDGLDVRRLGWFGSRRYPVAPGIWNATRHADIIHVHAVDFFFDALAATRAFHGKPMVASTHGGFFHTDFARGPKKVYFRTATRASIKAYDAVCASGESDYALFSGISDRVHRIGNGVESAKWADRASREPTKTLIYFGRISRNKRVDLLLLLLSRLVSADPEWRLIIAGTFWDVKEGAVREQIERLGLGAQVHLEIAPDDAGIGELIQQSSFYASASEHEGFGISVVEAMGAGLFPVLSRIPAFEALLSGVGTGVLVDDFASEEAASTLRQIAADLARSGDYARRRLMSSAGGYDWRERAEEVLQLYRSILDQRAPKGVAA